MALLLFSATLLSTTATSADDFFGDQLSVREKQAQARSNRALGTAVESIAAFGTLLIYREFAEGRCEGYFEIEANAKNGDGFSQHVLSDLYRNGYCVVHDDERALYWAQEAADGGWEPAFFDVGLFLFKGVGTQSDPASAVQWLEIAAATRIEAYFVLALIYLQGEGVTQNYERAYEYALKGARFGYAQAQAMVVVIDNVLGFRFSDSFQSYKWALIAKSSGEPEVLELIEQRIIELEGLLTPQQVTRAQAEASEWSPQTLSTGALAGPTDINLPILNLQETLALSQQQADARLAELGLERDRFLFFKAIADDNVGVTALYVRAGASPETISLQLFDTPLLHAARNGSSGVAQFLLSVGADIDRSVNSGDDTPVLLAISRRHRETADLLIARGASLDHPGIMYGAVEFDDAEFLAMLMSKGVPIDLDYVGTPLSNAVSATADDGTKRCYERSAAFLVASGARLDARNSLGESLLLEAIKTANPVGCVELLLQHGVSQAAPNGQEPLFLSVILGNASLVHLLLEHGADPNLRLELDAGQVPMVLNGDAKSAAVNGGSLLLLAVIEQHASIARLLLRYGADRNAADRLGRTPFSVALGNGDSLMIDVLLEDM